MSAVPQTAVLMYHRITSAEVDPWGMSVSRENFDAQMAALRDVATPLPLSDFIRRGARGDLPARSVVVTFDDGYVDNYDLARPILRRHDVPATFYITTCNLDTTREFWWDRLETLLLRPGALPERLDLDLGAGRFSMVLDRAATYTAENLRADRGVNPWSAGARGTRLGFFYEVWKALWPLAPEARDQALTRIAAWAGTEELPPGTRRSMTSEELRALAREPGIEIGAHTVDHPALPVKDLAEQTAQITGSRDRLTSILGAPVRTFAYPHGEYSAETVRLVREAGFETAVTVVQKLATPETDPMLLPRFSVPDVGAGDFLARLRSHFGAPGPGAVRSAPTVAMATPGSAEAAATATPGPLVSAVMIFLNPQPFIAEAIDSVLAQTWTNLELVLVDDGSTDGSSEVARDYATRYPDRVRVVSHPLRENRGMSASRNLGVRHARGEFIAFLDADDVWLPGKTAEQVAIFRERPELGMVYGKTQIWNTWDKDAPAARDFFYELGVAENAAHPPAALLGTLIENHFQSPTTCNAMIRRAAFEAAGGFDERFRGMYEDQVFFTKLYLAHSTFVSSRFWARYRQHAGSSGNRFAPDAYYRDRRELMETVFNLTGPHWESFDERTRTILRRELWRARHPRLSTWRMRLRTWWRRRQRARAAAQA